MRAMDHVLETEEASAEDISLGEIYNSQIMWNAATSQDSKARNLFVCK